MTFTDPHLARAAEAIDSGAYDALSLDVFDTLLWRRVPRPSDVFLVLGRHLAGADRAAVIARLRLRAETAARQASVDAGGPAQIPLAAIADAFPAGIADADPAGCESAVETELCRIAPETADLARHARARGLKVGLVSDTYFPAATLTALLWAAAPDLNWDFVIASCEHGRSKAEGLLAEAARQADCPPARLLHVGDNDAIDGTGARQVGAGFVHVPAAGPALEAALAAELPDAPARRAPLLGTTDHGLTHLRGRIGRRLDDPLARHGAEMVGPVLVAFLDWVRQRAADIGAPVIACPSREGRLFVDILDRLGADPPGRAFHLSRQASIRAALADGDRTTLARFLRRPVPLSLHRLLAQAGLDPDDCTGLPDLPVGPDAIDTVAARIPDALVARIAERAVPVRDGLIAHLRERVGLKAPLVLADLGFAGTIQENLRRALASAGLAIPIHGLYLATSAEAAGHQRADSLLEGWLAAFGEPVCVAMPLLRASRLLEQMCMCDEGSVRAYHADGTPDLGVNALPPAQMSAIARLQSGILALAESWNTLDPPPDASTRHWRGQIAAILDRLLTRPSTDETALFADWVFDENAGIEHTRPLVGAGPWQADLPWMTAHQQASLSAQDSPWLFASVPAAEAARDLWRHDRGPEAVVTGPHRQATLYLDLGAGLRPEHAVGRDIRFNDAGRALLSLTLDARPNLIALAPGTAGDIIRLDGLRLGVGPATWTADDLDARITPLGATRLAPGLFRLDRQPALLAIPVPDHLPAGDTLSVVARLALLPPAPSETPP